MNDNSLTHDKPIYRATIMALDKPFLELLLDSVCGVKKNPHNLHGFFYFSYYNSWCVIFFLRYERYIR